MPFPFLPLYHHHHHNNTTKPTPEVLILHDEEVVNLQDKMLEQLQHDPAEGGACSLATIAFNLAHLQVRNEGLEVKSPQS